MSEKESTHLKERNLIFFDTEFSGLHYDAELLQIGVLVVDPKTFQIKEEWATYITPEHIENADPKALEIIGYSDEWLETAIPLKDALEKFDEIAKDGVLVAYNIVMDFMHLKKAYDKFGMEPSFHWQVLDVLTMTYDHLYDKEELTSYRTGEVTEFLKIDSTKHHDALEDSRLAYKMFMQLTNRKIK